MPEEITFTPSAECLAAIEASRNEVAEKWVEDMKNLPRSTQFEWVKIITTWDEDLAGRIFALL